MAPRRLRGRGWNFASPGSDVLRASYREPELGRRPLEPGRVYPLRLERMLTAQRFARGDRLRVQISGAFAPHFSRNLQTGLSETEHAKSSRATITVHHDARDPSRLIVAVVPPPR